MLSMDFPFLQKENFLVELINYKFPKHMDLNQLILYLGMLQVNSFIMHSYLLLMVMPIYQFFCQVFYNLYFRLQMQLNTMVQEFSI